MALAARLSIAPKQSAAICRASDFSGHVNPPSRPEPSGFAAGVEKGGYLHLAHPIFTCYHRAGAVAMLEIAEATILRALGGRKLIATTLPRAGRVTVRHQPGARRDVVHLLHATPALRGNLRGANIQPIQDLVTLREVRVDLAAAALVRSVRLVPEETPLNFRHDDGRVIFTVPSVRGHQMVDVAYV